MPVSIAIGAHREHDKEFNEIGENLSTFRTNSSLFSTKSDLQKQILDNASQILDEDEDGKHFITLRMDLFPSITTYLSFYHFLHLKYRILCIFLDDLANVTISSNAPLVNNDQIT